MKPGDQKGSWQTVLLKLLRIAGIMFVVSTGLFGLFTWLSGTRSGGVVISLSVLAGLPFLLGAFTSYLLAPNGGKSSSFYHWAPILMTVVMLFAGGFLFREGIICLIMLSPIWMPLSWWGSYTVRKFQERENSWSKTADTFNVSLVFVIPVMFAVMDQTVPQQISTYRVERSVVLNAAPDQIWPLLLEMKDIGTDEGQWNIAQDWLRIPRPASAVVEGEGEGARRMAAWGPDITFEEHLTGWEEGRVLTWNFVFPNDSVHKYTDEHISPDGRHLRIGEGGYRLNVMGDGRTRLVLYTDYEAQTPVNAYARIWGEIILGGIQGNILAIIKDRI